MSTDDEEEILEENETIQPLQNIMLRKLIEFSNEKKV